MADLRLGPAVTVGVVTIAAGRRGHLSRQASSIVEQDCAPDRYVIVDLGGPELSRSLPPGVDPIVISERVTGDLPLARARNLGASAADTDVTVFLDVDCIADPALVRTYRDACTTRPGIHAGPVGYLPADAPTTIATRRLEAVARYQPGRPTPTTSMHRTERIELFWSLSFAVDRASWHRIGGFDERYVGYGGEDTDFARRAALRGVPIWFSGRSRAFHQWHPIDSPPVSHLASICRNASIFRDTWGEWPMIGWLERFSTDGLIDWHPDGDTCDIRAEPAPHRTG
jgi:GT2 family glycosyltransferase